MSAVAEKDGGKDALFISNEGKTVIHISLRKDWERKIKEDLETTRKHNIKCDKFVFVSNRLIPPIQRDKLKEMILNEYNWEADFFDQERLRVELDNHRRDLRKQFFGINEEYENYIEETINGFIEKRDEIYNYTFHSKYSRLLLLSIPTVHIKNRMKLFDEKMKFIGNKERLSSVLSRNLPDKNVETKNTTDSFSVSYKEKEEKSSFLLISPFNKERIFEANLYNNGIIEIMLDFNDTKISFGLIREILNNFFLTINDIYKYFIKDEERIAIVLCLLNSSSMFFEKNKILYNGEDYFFCYKKEEELNKILSPDFKNDFIEILTNKIDNFFNIVSEYQKE